MTLLEMNIVSLASEPSLLTTIPCYTVLEEPQIPIFLEISYCFLSDLQVFFAQTTRQIRIRHVLQWGLILAKCMCYLHVSLPLRLSQANQAEAAGRQEKSLDFQVGGGVLVIRSIISAL